MSNSQIDEIIRNIIKATTPYEVLGITKESSNQEIKSKYHKLSKIIHPDRCKHEKATECFQKVSEAHIILTDSIERRMYDSGEKDWMYGKKSSNQFNDDSPIFTEGIIPSMFGYEDDISPEEVITALFGDKNNLRNCYENRCFFTGKMKSDDEINENEMKSSQKVLLYQSFCFLLPICVSCLFIMKNFFI